MPQLASTRREQAEPGIAPVRDGGDACPGALRLHAADDGALARIRVPAGLLTARQAMALADMATRLSDGHLDVTSRGNLQLRGLHERHAPQLAAELHDLGLLPSPRHERVRNLVASPLSGLDGRGNAEVHCWAARLDELLCASESATQLSGRFLFALDDGRGDVAGLDADVTLLALPGGRALLRMGAEAEAVCVPEEDAPASALLAAEAFLKAAQHSGERVWRVRELPYPHGSFARDMPDLLRSRGINARPVTEFPEVVDAPPAPGVINGPGARCALSVMAPLGRYSSSQWRQLAALAAAAPAVPATPAATRHGQAEGELRVTPWRGVVLTGVPQAEAAQRLRELEAAGLITHSGSPWMGVGACTGLPGCARAHRDVRSDAASALTGTAVEPGRLLPVHWSGCERRCGRPPGDRVDVVAGEDGYTVAVQTEDSTDKRAVPDAELAPAVASARARNGEREYTS